MDPEIGGRDSPETSENHTSSEPQRNGEASVGSEASGDGKVTHRSEVAKSVENSNILRTRLPTELPRPQIARHSAEEELQSKKFQMRSAKTIIIPTISPDVLREQTARSPNAWADLDFGGNQNDVTFDEMYRQIDSPKADDSPGFRNPVPAPSQNILDLRHILEESSSSDVVDSPDFTVTFDQPAGRLGRLGPNLSRSSTSLPRFSANMASPGIVESVKGEKNESKSRLNPARSGKTEPEDESDAENEARN